MIRVRQRIP